MNPQSTNELAEFQRFITEKVNNGGADLSPEEALDEWHESHPDPADIEDDAAAIQEAVDDMAQGDRGRDFDEVIADIRAQYGLPKP